MKIDYEVQNTMVRIPLDLYERVKQLAIQEDRSINAQIVVFLKDAVKRSRYKKPQKTQDESPEGSEQADTE